MTADEAFQQYLDKKIPKELREGYSQAIGWMRAGWFAALEWVKSQKKDDES